MIRVGSPKLWARPQWQTLTVQASTGGKCHKHTYFGRIQQLNRDPTTNQKYNFCFKYATTKRKGDDCNEDQRLAITAATKQNTTSKEKPEAIKQSKNKQQNDSNQQKQYLQHATDTTFVDNVITPDGNLELWEGGCQGVPWEGAQGIPSMNPRKPKERYDPVIP